VYRLEEDDVTRLSNQPETGMGYQLIQAKVGGKDDLFLVFNCELLATLEELSDVKEYFTEDKLKDLRPPPDFKSGAVVPLSSLPTRGWGASTTTVNGHSTFSTGYSKYRRL
jgi:hypothetical protein